MIVALYLRIIGLVCAGFAGYLAGRRAERASIVCRWLRGRRTTLGGAR